MKKISTVLLAFLPFFAVSLFAQLPLRHHFPPLKGKVLKREVKSYMDVNIDANGKPIIDKPSFERDVHEYENGLLKRITFYSDLGGAGEEMDGRMEFAYEKGQVVNVKEFVGSRYGRDKGELQLHASFFQSYNNGVLESENRFDKNGKLLGTFKYLPPIIINGSPLYVFDDLSFVNGDMKKGDRFGVQYDATGMKTLHFQVENASDTVFLIRAKRLSKNEVKMLLFTSSKAKFTETTIHTHQELDAKGNEIWSVQSIPDESGKEKHSAQIIRYQYEGDPAWPTKEVISRSELIGFWKNDKENIQIEFNDEMVVLLFYGAPLIADDGTDKLMEDSKSWIYQLSKTQRGSCEWDAANQTLEMKGKSGVIVKVSVQKKGDALILTPPSKWQSPLYLNKISAKIPPARPPQAVPDLPQIEAAPKPYGNDARVIEAPVGQATNATNAVEEAKTPPKYFPPYTSFEENGKFGCIDAYKRKMIPAIYDELRESYAYSGYILVRKGNLWGMVDLQNQALLPIQFKDIEWNVSYVLLTNEQGKKGIANKDGRMVLSCIYDKLGWEMSLGAFKAEKDHFTGLYSESGQEIIPLKYENIRGAFNLKEAYAARKGGKWGLIDRSEKILFPFQYDDLEFLEYPMDLKGEKKQLLRAKKGDVWGAVDGNNHIHVPFEYRGIGAAADRKHFMVRKGDKLGMIDQDLNIMIPIEYVQITQPMTDIFMTLNEQGLLGIRNIKGIIVPEKYKQEDIEVKGRVIRVKEGDHFLLYSQQGAFEPFPYASWEMITSYSSDVLSYLGTDGRNYLVSTEGKNCPAIEIYEGKEIREGRKNKFLVLRGSDAKGKPLYGLRDARNGRCVAPMIYSELDFNVTLTHIDAFTRAVGDISQYVVALGRESKKAPWMLIGSEGMVVVFK